MKRRSCPFGHVCEECILYEEHKVFNAQTQTAETVAKCAFSWLVQTGIDTCRMLDVLNHENSKSAAETRDVNMHMASILESARRRALAKG